jgi:hypothetical protein
MNIREAGQKGGLSQSSAKRAAAKQNGTRGGRPKQAHVLLRRMRALYAKIGDQCRHIDPGDLGLIIERLCRAPNSGRQFFIFPRQGGGYGF